MFEVLAEQVSGKQRVLRMKFASGEARFLCCVRAIDAEYDVIFNASFYATSSVLLRSIG